MGYPYRRRTFLRSAGLAVLAATGWAQAACGSGITRHTTTPPAGPITITHVFGETIIPQPPHRVVCVGYTGQDDVLALNITPLAITEWLGHPPGGIWPWQTAAWQGTQPQLLHRTPEIPYEKIGALDPDLIIAVNAGLDHSTYHRLADIAPTLAHTTSNAFFEPWKIQATTISHALYHADTMRTLISHVDQVLGEVPTTHPQLKGYRVALLSGQIEKDHAAVISDWHSDFLTTMGCHVVSLPSLVPVEQLPIIAHDLDGIIWITQTEKEQHTIITHPQIAPLGKRNIVPSLDLAAAIMFGSVLSYPFVVSHLPELFTPTLHP